MCGGEEPPHDPAKLEIKLKFDISEMPDRLEESGIVKAASACTDAGNISKATEIALDTAF